MEFPFQLCSHIGNLCGWSSSSQNLSLKIETGFLPSTGATTIPSSISQADGISETKVVSIDGVLNSDKGSSSVSSPNDDSNCTSIGSSKHFSSSKYIVSSSVLKRCKPRISTGMLARLISISEYKSLWLLRNWRKSLRNGVVYLLAWVSWVACLRGWCGWRACVSSVLAWVAC